MAGAYPGAYYGRYYSAQEGEMARIREMLGLFLDKIWFILGATLITFIGAVIFYFAMPNQYLTRTRLLIKNPPQEVFLQAQEYRDLMFMQSPSESFLTTQITMIKSRQAMRRLIERMGLRAFGDEKQSLTSDLDRLVAMLSMRIGVNMVRGTNLLDISVTLSSPVLAANVTNTLAEIYIEQYKSDILSWAREIAGRILREKQEGATQEQFSHLFASLLGSKSNTLVGRLSDRRDRLLAQVDDLSLYYKEQFPEIVHLKRKVEELNREIEKESNKAIDEWIQSLDGQDLLSGASIAEYAEIPDKPVGPKRVRGIILVTLLGAAGACGLVFFLHQLDPRIKSEEELMQETGMVCLGIVPKLLGSSRMDNYTKLPMAVQDNIAYIRTALRFSMPQDKSKVIMLTSALRSEGKTTMSANISASFAHDGLKTVLIDADTRRPRVHEIFHLDKAPGLTNFLKDGISIESILRESGDPNLKVITAGDGSSNPTALLSSEKVKELVQGLRKDYDKVLLDTPPVLNIADALILGPLADGVVLVINAEKTEKRLIKKIMEQFQQAGETVIGGIINYYDTSRHSYYLNVYMRTQKDSYETTNVVTQRMRKFLKKIPFLPVSKH